MGRPWFKSSTTAAVTGVILFAAGWACFYDAYDGRGRDQPKLLRPFTWW